MINNNLFLSKTTLNSKSTLHLLMKIMHEDRKDNHIWSISDNSLVFDDYISLQNYLLKDFGQYLLYIAHNQNAKLGIFGMLNLSDYDNCSNILIWLDKSIRKSNFAMKWFVLFLKEAQKENVVRWYAKIKKFNNVSINSAKRYGFQVCNNSKNEDLYCVTRKTLFNDFEKRYIQRYMPNILKNNL